MNFSPLSVPEAYQCGQGHNNVNHVLLLYLLPIWGMGQSTLNPRCPASLVKLGHRQGQAISISHPRVAKLWGQYYRGQRGLVGTELAAPLR